MSDDVIKDLRELATILGKRIPFMKTYNDMRIEVVKSSTRLVIKDSKIVEEEIPPKYFVKVIYFNPKIEGFNQNGFESIEFPIEDLPKRIEHYKNKLNYELTKQKARSNN